MGHAACANRSEGSDSQNSLVSRDEEGAARVCAAAALVPGRCLPPVEVKENRLRKSP